MESLTTSQTLRRDGIDQYLEILGIETDTEHLDLALREELKTTPLFTWEIKVRAAAISTVDSDEETEEPALGRSESEQAAFGKFAVLGSEFGSMNPSDRSRNRPFFMNVDAPWSAFICGSQGSGKSYTLSCMVEGCLMPDSRLGTLSRPPCGVLFHYDPHNSLAPCEAAYLSSHIPITILVSPSNFWQRERLYRSVRANITVRPLLLKDEHLNVQRIQRLMAFTDANGALPLYMEVIMRILRKMAIQGRGRQGLDWAAFLALLDAEENLVTGQKGPMHLRLQLLSSFMGVNYSFNKDFGLSNKAKNADPFAVNEGELTIIDLSDPLVDSAGACSLFDMCLGLFLERNTPTGKLVVLDEAHKFLTGGDASNTFTNSLLQLIREQRHKGARVILSTQEPTVSPSLLELCSMTFVHRFTSPAWLVMLRHHLAGAGVRDASLMNDIINLQVGQCLLFSPSSMVDVVDGSVARLGQRFIKFKTRRRITDDGGRSVLSVASR